MDTIPGNHGGINELGAERHESADVVLHHAITFLRKNGTTFRDSNELSARVKKNSELMVLYATIMDHFMEYKAQGKEFGSYLFPGGNSKGGRVYNQRKETSTGVGQAISRGLLEKNKFEGHRGIAHDGGMRLGRRPRPSRFFANLDHEDLFSERYGATCALLKEAQRLNGDALMRKVEEMQDSPTCNYELEQMPEMVRRNLDTWMDVALGRQ